MNIQIGHDTAIVESKKQLITGTYLRNAWYCAAWSETLGDNGVLGVTFLKEPVVLYRQGNGEVAALEDRCAHRFAPLSMGAVIGGNRIQCPYHGLEYDKTGACVLQPHGNKNIPSRAKVKSYPAVEKHKAIWVWMGDKTADPATVPDFSVMDNVPALHTTKLDKIMVKANYELVVDNLLDLSHTSYLHAGILGNADTVESEITVLQDGTDITVERHATNAEPPGMNKLMWPQSPPRVDKITSIRWMAPSTLRLVTGICPIGEKPETGTGYHAVHILTPETDRTTHYFFTAVRYNVKTTDEALNRDIQEKIGKMRRFAFEEQDVPVIEAQQRIIDESQTAVDPLTLAIDVGPVRYKHILKKLIAAEQAQ
ncbi:MAG: aromatic ring-hydroxylating dioxygenase subunit alpha [Hyphomicrobiales bacterium]|nr:aromatic ring-hydroxylating dioxygenase subunit alpha [Alphaproteobacteria bacterium]